MLEVEPTGQPKRQWSHGLHRFRSIHHVAAPSVCLHQILLMLIFKLQWVQLHAPRETCISVCSVSRKQDLNSLLIVFRVFTSQDWFEGPLDKKGRSNRNERRGHTMWTGGPPPLEGPLSYCSPNFWHLWILTNEGCVAYARIKHTHTHGSLRFYLGLPGWAGTRKVKSVWIYCSKR